MNQNDERQDRQDELHTDPAIDESILSDDLKQLEQRQKRRRRLFVRIIAGLTAFAFLFLSFSGVLRLAGLPSLEFLMESRQLSQRDDISRYKSSIYAISADGHRGTGFAAADLQMLVTNYHIIKDTSLIEAKDANGQVSAFRAWYQAPEVDLVLIELEAKMLADGKGLSLETNQLPALNETVIMIGNPLGFFNIVNEATYLGEALLAGWDVPVLKIQGPVYKGNSGSPVINQHGKVIGIIFATSANPPEDDEQPIGYVIPASVIQAVYDSKPITD